MSLLAKIARDAEILESMKPTKVINNVKADFVSKKGSVNLECTRFNTRIVPGRFSDQVCEFMYRFATNPHFRIYRSSTSKPRLETNGQQ